MKRLTALAAMTVCVLGLLGCAALAPKGTSGTTGPNDEKKVLAERVAAFEQRPASAEDTAYTDAVSEFGNLSIKPIYTMAGFTEAEAADLVARVQKAWQSKVREAIKLAGDDANQAYWLGLAALLENFKYDKLEPDTFKAVRDAAQRRAAMREAQLKANGSYAVANGDAGNCVFSPTPFGAEGTSNPGLTYYVTGASTVLNVRCYGPTPLASYSGKEAKFTLQVGISQFSGITQPAGTPASYAAGVKHVDFQVTIPWAGLANDDFAAMDVALLFSEVTGEKIQDGQLTPVWSSKKVASSTLLWEKNPAALQ